MVKTATNQNGDKTKTATGQLRQVKTATGTLSKLMQNRGNAAILTFERRFCIAWAVLSSSSYSSLLYSRVDQLYFIIIVVSCHDVLERVHQLFHL